MCGSFSTFIYNTVDGRQMNYKAICCCKLDMTTTASPAAAAACGIANYPGQLPWQPHLSAMASRRETQMT